MANQNSRSYPKGLREIRYPSNDVIHRYTSKDYTGTIKLNNETGLFEFNPPLEGLGGSSGTTFNITQASHGFTDLQPITHDGNMFNLASATADNTLGLWVITAVTSPDTFTAAQSGRFEITGHGLAPGHFYFTGTSPGSLSPIEGDTYSNPLIYIESVDVFHVLPYRPSSTQIGSVGGGGAVDSVFGRTGVVVAESGDYTKEQVGLGNVDDVQQIPLTQKAAINGVASLDGGGKVPTSQLPVAVSGGINIIGYWDANTNTPDIAGLSLADGEAYQVTVAGSTDLNGITTWNLYDLAVYDSGLSGNWFKISSAGQVESVNGQTGAVTLVSSDIPEGTNLYYTEGRVDANTTVVANAAKISADSSITTHSDVDTLTIAPAVGQILSWNGTNWVPSNDMGGDMSKSTYDPTNVSGDAFDRANHSGTITASTVSDFDAEVSNNIDVTANTAKITFPEAPDTGIQYARQSESWQAISTGATSFLGLVDTPGDYAGQEGKTLLVKSTADGLEFGEASGGSASPEWVLNTLTTWDGTSYSPDLVLSDVDERTIDDTVTTLVFANPSNMDIAIGRKKYIVIDNSSNTVAINSITFGDSYNFAAYVRPSGMAIGEKATLELFNNLGTVRADWSKDEN